jgi:hypothetical protein
MKLLRAIASILAAALMALGLSVGAAMAEGPHEPAKQGHYTPAGLCLLEVDAKK